MNELNIYNFLVHKSHGLLLAINCRSCQESCTVGPSGDCSVARRQTQRCHLRDHMSVAVAIYGCYHHHHHHYRQRKASPAVAYAAQLVRSLA